MKDHAVAFCPETNLYFDGDGWQTEAELFHKMRTVEFTDVQVLMLFADIDDHPIYLPIKEKLLAGFAMYTAEEQDSNELQYQPLTP